MIRTLDNPLYYLDNFHRVMEWIDRHYRTLMSVEENAFIKTFQGLPQASQALLVRMIMRKGNLFRLTKLHYEEIGCIRSAAELLVEQGWVHAAPPLSIDSLFSLLTKPELAGVFTDIRASARKTDQLEALREQYPGERSFSEWCPHVDECVYQLLIGAMCDRFRLMFFGNLRQNWTEFVLADLGIFKYEQVPRKTGSPQPLLWFRRRWYENRPSTTSAIIIMVARTGLPMLMRVNHMESLCSAFGAALAPLPRWNDACLRTRPKGASKVLTLSPRTIVRASSYDSSPLVKLKR